MNLDLEYEWLPQSTLLYRGVLGADNLQTDYKWFMPDKHAASIYGNIIYTYQTRIPLMLLIINPENLSKILNYAHTQNRNDVVEAISTSFGITDKNNAFIVRISEYESDAIILKFLCDYNIQGYIAQQLSKSYDGNSNLFHSEVGLCKPYNVITLLGNPTVLNPSIRNVSNIGMKKPKYRRISDDADADADADAVTGAVGVVPKKLFF